MWYGLNTETERDVDDIDETGYRMGALAIFVYKLYKI